MGRIAYNPSGIHIFATMSGNQPASVLDDMFNGVANSDITLKTLAVTTSRVILTSDDCSEFICTPGSDISLTLPAPVANFSFRFFNATALPGGSNKNVTLVGSVVIAGTGVTVVNPVFPRTINGVTCLGGVVLYDGSAWQMYAMPFSAGTAPLGAFWTSPADFGAVGDDSTDDTSALQAMGAAVQAAGGGYIIFPPNKTYKVYSAGQPLNALFNFIGLKNVTVDMRGSQIKVYKNFVGTGLILFLIIVDGCRNTVFLNMDFKQNTPVTVPGTVEGVSPIIFQRGSYDTLCNNIKLDGGVLPIQFQRTTASEDLTKISGRAFIANLFSTNSIYGFNCADSGNDICIRNLVTSNVMRSYFVYGANNHDVEVTSTNAQSNDCLLVASVTSAGTPTNALENIKVRYKVMGRSAGQCPSYLTIGMAQNISNGILRNIDAEIDMDYTGEPGTGALPPAVQFLKAGAGVQNLTFDAIRIHGGIRNVPNSAGDLLQIFPVAKNPWSGETARNMVIGPLLVTGSTTPTFQINFDPFNAIDSVLRLVDVQFPGASSWTNVGALNLSQQNSTLSDRRSRDTYVVFTPVWSAAGSAPSLGNGTITGVYRRYGKAATVTIKLVAGSTTTFGTGQWQFGMPALQYLDELVGYVAIGSAYALQSGVAHHVGVALTKSDFTPNWFLISDGASSGWGSTLPFSWAVNDTMIFTVTYTLGQ